MRSRLTTSIAATLAWLFLVSAGQAERRSSQPQGRTGGHGVDAAAARNLKASSEFSAAIDINGVRHLARDYHPKMPPWIVEQQNAVPPEYPYYDRRDHHQGVGFFRLYLDVRNGGVGRIEMVKSTGYETLDHATMKALQKWTWKPARWKQIDIPVRFVMSSHSSRSN
ncbi:MAG: TonB family protein [Chthoniobacterales bacterium]